MHTHIPYAPLVHGVSTARVTNQNAVRRSRMVATYRNQIGYSHPATYTHRKLYRFVVFVVGEKNNSLENIANNIHSLSTFFSWFSKLREQKLILQSILIYLPNYMLYNFQIIFNTQAIYIITVNILPILLIEIIINNI
jgi:hypothetical protein